MLLVGRLLRDFMMKLHRWLAGVTVGVSQLAIALLKKTKNKKN